MGWRVKLEIRWAITVFFAAAIVFAVTSLVLLDSGSDSNTIAADSSDFNNSPTEIAAATTTSIQVSTEQDSISTQLLASPSTVLPEPESTTTLAETTTTTAPDKFATFTPNEFRDLFDPSTLPNLQPIDSPQAITGNSEADTHIRSLAEARGYSLRPIPVDSLGSVNNLKLQPRALIAWQDMSAAAEAQGVDLRLISGLRLPEAQKNLFLTQLNRVTTNYSQIPSGQYDSQIQEILNTSAIPGYSKHHTGYAIDIASDSNDLKDFINTNGYDWISANNFENAKEYGFIPSYPEGADSQGPLPEAWEYVWVGQDALLN